MVEREMNALQFFIFCLNAYKPMLIDADLYLDLYCNHSMIHAGINCIEN